MTVLRWAFPVFVVINLSRGGFNSVWAEDGQEFLTDALTLPWFEPFATPFNGYFHTLARACFALIALFPVPWAAALNAGTAAVLTAALACLVAAAARDRLGTAAGLVIGASAAVPMGYAPNTLAQLQFPLVYAGLWMLLWTPSTRAARVVAVALPGLAALSSMLGLLLVPVALLRTARRRDRDSVLRALALLPGAALQLGSLLLGASRRDVGEQPDLDPFSVAGTYLRWGVPRSFLGDAWLAEPVTDPVGHRGLILLGLAVPVAVVVAALLRGTSQQQWRLATFLAGFAAFAGAFQLAVHGVPESRYLVLIALPNIAAAVALAGSADPPGRSVPFVALATLVAVVGIANLRPGGYTATLPRWDTTVAGARAQCQAEPRLRRVTVHTAQWPVLGWKAVLPCDRLR
ncbi:hypothetical protein ACFO1B_29875 [Dactylosporangium siamense]|uniref:Uncharacterized protein n=1 Tax=Dactylosporangium siamense TaxID=685454 RepID=A0A919PRC8_9ACTN|nr:hypothetical protein [Dactylosporangium siamense]GIG48317.1 hypothetical protein Dsi01nite_063580 [Dactylosporangium siamense]